MENFNSNDWLRIENKSVNDENAETKKSLFDDV